MYDLLNGLRVVEGSAFIAGPTCGLYLAQLGAEVIRFDNIGGGPDFAPNILFYVAVPDVAAALRRVEELGGTRLLGPTPTPSGRLVVGRFTDPEGNLMGVAGPK